MIRFCRALFVVSVMLSWSATSAFAQAAEGDKEVLLDGNVTSAFGGNTGTAVTAGSLSAGLGYYFTERVELFGSVSLSISKQALAGTSVDAGTGVSFRYNFTQPGVKTVPYVGFAYALNSVRQPKDSSLVEPNAGLKYYLRPKVAFDINVSYGHALFSNAGGNVISERVGLVFGL